MHSPTESQLYCVIKVCGVGLVDLYSWGSHDLEYSGSKPEEQMIKHWWPPVTVPDGWECVWADGEGVGLLWMNLNTLCVHMGGGERKSSSPTVTDLSRLSYSSYSPVNLWIRDHVWFGRFLARCLSWHDCFLKVACTCHTSIFLWMFATVST